MRKQEVKKTLERIRTYNIFPNGETNWRVVANRIIDEIEKELEIISKREYLSHFKAEKPIPIEELNKEAKI